MVQEKSAPSSSVPTQNSNPKTQSHYNYYGVTGNYKRLEMFWHQVGWDWMKWLVRRTRGDYRSMERFNNFAKRYPLPKPRIVHGYAV